jgi:RNA polymerase sigma factor (sigma-70 family)
VAGWSSLGSVEDRRLAQSLLDGLPGTLAEIYDFYAPRLYDYCHALLRDQDLAADALHDSLIATQQHIAKLREQERFRSWLYAIVRNECIRLLTEPDRPGQGRQAPEESDDAFLDAAERQRREETRQLVHSALVGLTSPEREALDLAARHDLYVEELSGVLGMSSQDATELVRRARDGLDGTLSAALIAHTGTGDCPSVAALADEQGWPLSPEVCRRIVRHVESCPTCRDNRRRGADTTRMMRVLPVAAIPAELRMAVLTLADAPDQHERRTLVAQRAEPFDVWGWPVSLDRVRPREQGRKKGPRLLPAVGAAAAVVALIGGVFLLTRGPSEPRHATPSPAFAAPSDPLSESPSPSDSPDSPEPSKSSPSPTHTTHRPTPTPTHTRPKPTPSRTSKPPAPTPGTLAVTGCSMDRADQRTCLIQLTAQGGPVSWRVTGTNGVDAAPGSGTLKRGQSTAVIAHRGDTCTGNGGSGSVSFSPNGTATVTWTCTANGPPATSPQN